MAHAKKANSSAKRAPKSTKKVAVSKNAQEMQGKNPAAKPSRKNAQQQPQGAVRTRFESTKKLLVSGLTSAKDFIINCFVGVVDFMKVLFESVIDFFKGFADREQWKNKSAYMKNIFNVIALVAVIAILGQMTIASFGWAGLAMGSAAATVVCYGINRLAMTEGERETAGTLSLKDAVVPQVA